MHRGERQLHLGLDARDLRDTEPGRLASGIPQQRRLPDARLATNDEDGALTPAHIRQQPIDQLPLAGPSEEPPRTGGGHLSVEPKRARARRPVTVPERWRRTPGRDQGIHGCELGPEPRL
jgi:hypothetical protein